MIQEYSNIQSLDNGLNYQLVIDYLGQVLADEKNIQFLTSDEQKLEFLKQFIQIKSL